MNKKPLGTTDVTHHNWNMLRMHGENLDSCEALRIQIENRASHFLNFTQEETIDNKLVTKAREVEKDALKALTDCYHLLAPAEIVQWQKENKGLGEKTVARLLGHLGDPLIATPMHWEGVGETKTLIEDPPRYRTIAQLWAYSSLGDSSVRRIKSPNQRQLLARGNPEIGKAMHNIVKPLIMSTKGSDSPYYALYAETRVNVNDRIHENDCPQCVGQSKAGEPWKDGHKDAHARRVVKKRILKDLWTLRYDAVS